MQCEYSHSHQQVPFACIAFARRVPRPVWIGPEWIVSSLLGCRRIKTVLWSMCILHSSKQGSLLTNSWKVPRKSGTNLDAKISQWTKCLDTDPEPGFCLFLSSVKCEDLCYCSVAIFEQKSPNLDKLCVQVSPGTLELLLFAMFLNAQDRHKKSPNNSLRKFMNQIVSLELIKVCFHESILWKLENFREFWLHKKNRQQLILRRCQLFALLAERKRICRLIQLW